VMRGEEVTEEHQFRKCQTRHGIKHPTPEPQLQVSKHQNPKSSAPSWFSLCHHSPIYTPNIILSTNTAKIQTYTVDKLQHSGPVCVWGFLSTCMHDNSSVLPRRFFSIIFRFKPSPRPRPVKPHVFIGIESYASKTEICTGEIQVLVIS